MNLIDKLKEQIGHAYDSDDYELIDVLVNAVKKLTEYQWKPIDTAPKNCRLLVKLGDGSRCFGRWFPQDDVLETAAGWYDGVWKISPTQWMHVPE